jgi:prophage antirepressor-like protein
MNQLNVVHEQEVLGQSFKVYGNKNKPLFLAKEVAEWIDNKNVSQMLNVVDDEEKALYTMYRVDGSSHKQWFLTEHGLYEVLMQSRKDIARPFKQKVKNILTQIRDTGGYIPTTQEDDDQMIMAKALLITQKTIEKKDQKIEQQQQAITAQNSYIAMIEPKAQNYEKFLNENGELPLKYAHEVIGETCTRNMLYRVLREHKVLLEAKEGYDRSGKYVKIPRNSPNSHLIANGMFVLCYTKATYKYDYKGKDVRAKEWHLSEAGIEHLKTFWDKYGNK